jgi:Phosphotransferase enzyme family
MSQRVTPDALKRVLREHAGLGFATVTAAGGGESGNAFVATDHSGTASIVKIRPGAGPDAVGQLRELKAAAERLRERGYTAPRIRAFGHVPGMDFWVTELLPGTPMGFLDQDDGGSGDVTRAWLLPELLRLNDAQAELGTGTLALGDLVRETLARGGDGYCVHETLQADPRTRDMLTVLRETGERFGSSIPDAGDFVHYDFNPANLLSDGTTVTGVIDINAPLVSGDRAFDIATLLFYCYDRDELRDRLRARLLELTSPEAAKAYLAHMVLRQVDWSLRHHPGTVSAGRHLRLGALVTEDIRSP